MIEDTKQEELVLYEEQGAGIRITLHRPEVHNALAIRPSDELIAAVERAIWGMPEVDSGITPGWGGTTRMARLIGRRMTKEINMLGALHPARRAVELGLWNRAVPDSDLDAEVNSLLEVLESKDQQVLRQLKL